MSYVKKAGGKVYGMTLTSAEKKAMDMEIQRQLIEYDRKNAREIDAIVLWELRRQFGFGPKRLRRFYDNFAASLDALLKRYEMDNSDQVWLCTHQLKEDGIDLEQWEKERTETTM